MTRGAELAASLRSGQIVALTGDLGAGKTHFCKGIVEGLESEDDVTSPTFSLVNEYHSGRLPVFHFDFYRLDSVDELEQIGWEEYLFADGVLLVEWADRFPESIPEEAIWCRFSVNEKSGQRSIEIEGIDA